MRFLVFIVLTFVWIDSFSQSAVVNSYYNTADVRNEWTEILVVEDNLDMRNWTLRDNNSNQNSWQTAITFNNIAFWSNMRAGTIIVVWHRIIDASETPNPEDVDKSDGYIQLTAQNTSYFSGGTFGSAPGWSGNTLNIAAGGEIIQLRDASATHVHAMGHRSTTGADWNALPAPKINHPAGITSGDALYTCPGAVLVDFNGPASGGQTEASNANLTFGLPNTCGASANGNTDFFRLLREPQMTAQTVTASTAPTSPTLALTFTWDAATDPNPGDNTQGYIIVRNSLATIGDPVDGTTYNIGDAIPGGGTVIDHIDNPGTATVTYSDYDPDPTGTNCYKVFAYRYGTDNLHGNSYHLARGKAYNTANFVTIDCASNPLPVAWLHFDAEKDDGRVILRWSTATEINNSHFELEKSVDGGNFNLFGTVAGSGNSVQVVHYSAQDIEPTEGVNYYRIKQVDFDGEYAYSQVKAVQFDEGKLSTILIYSFDEILIHSTCPRIDKFEVFSLTGQRVFNAQPNNDTYRLDKKQFSSGIYLLSIQCGNQIENIKFVVN